MSDHLTKNISQETPNKEWVVKVDAAEVAEYACNIILQAATTAIQGRGKFRIVLAGGTTPGHIYKMLAKEPCDWNNWEIFLGDERCLPPTSEDRNSQMALNTLINDIEIPESNIYFIQSELGSEKAAENYAGIIKDKMPFDITLLGMGEDGHTASLFPGHTHNESELVHSVHNAPKPPSERVSLSASSLSNSNQVLMIITGAGKKDSVEAWEKGDALPIAEISALNTLTVILDKDASPQKQTN